MKFYKILIPAILALFVLASCGEEKSEPMEEETSLEELQQEVEEAVKEGEKSAEEAMEETEKITEEVKEEAGKIVEEVKKSVSTTDYTKTPLKGYVAHLGGIVNGGGKVNKERAEKMAEAGEVIVFVAGGQAYLVYDSGAMYRGKQLVKYADSEMVEMYGTVKMVHGVPVFLMTKANPA